MMDNLIIRSLQGRTTEDEEERLQRWRARSPANERRYRALHELWNLTGAAAPDREEPLPNVDDLVEDARAARERDRPRQGSRSTSPWRRRLAVGAAAAGLVGIGAGVGLLFSGGDPAPGMLSEGEIVTGPGEMTTITLQDGSSIRLGPESRLTLAADDDRRVVWLAGRAFFGVRADSARPFSVRTEYGEAEVLGTRFEVRSEEEFRVLVVEGSVSVAADGEQIDVSDGEISRSGRDRRLSTERVPDVYRHLDWLGNTLVFQATPFDRAISEIERRYGVNIRLEDPRLTELSVTATFTGRSVEPVISVLCEIVNATCSIEGDRIRIGRTGPGTTRYTDER